MKVSPGLEDAFIPMLADDLAALQQQRRKRDEHWLRMQKARLEWLEITGFKTDVITTEFWDWLANTYGLVPDRDDYGNVKEGYAITDEKLYTIFLLKFGQ